jgi:DNA invertase Pin-like site-specific DNA recombinase
MLDQLRDGDTVVVWKLDRLSRSLKDVLHIMENDRSSRRHSLHRAHGCGRLSGPDL